MVAIFALYDDRSNQSVSEPNTVELCHGVLANENWVVSSGLFKIFNYVFRSFIILRKKLIEKYNFLKHTLKYLQQFTALCIQKSQINSFSKLLLQLRFGEHNLASMEGSS